MVLNTAFFFSFFLLRFFVLNFPNKVLSRQFNMHIACTCFPLLKFNEAVSYTSDTNTSNTMLGKYTHQGFVPSYFPSKFCNMVLSKRECNKYWYYVDATIITIDCVAYVTPKIIVIYIRNLCN